MSLNKNNEELIYGLNDSHIIWLSDNIGIHKDMKNAWIALSDAAKEAGFSLSIASGFRSFDRQALIWNRKFSLEQPILDVNNNVVDISSLSDFEKVKAIMLFSAIPGASRHHWGTDIDVYDKNLLKKNERIKLLPTEYQTIGSQAPLASWLKNNAKRFQFYLPYDTYRGGVAEEPWHLSYHPLASQYQNSFNKELFSKIIINGKVMGSQTIIDNLSYLTEKYIENIGEF